MFKHPEQRVGVFVDVGNMYHSAKNLHNAKVNFKEVLKAAVSDRKLVRAIAYVINSKAQEEQKFFEALDNQGFEVRMKDLQVFLGGNKKGDWDAGMVVDVIKLAPKLDVVVLVTGDGDFAPLVEYLQAHGTLVEAIGFRETTSARLIETADDYTDLSDPNNGGRRRFLLR
ncbi:NYN domain-containing protein [Candidatus Uhrbacteria bacterium]|nr:NYN domain-containing protein [Candidatus Uhrbacteria bacterium]